MLTIGVEVDDESDLFIEQGLFESVNNCGT
jgi:hypothetical protein